MSTIVFSSLKSYDGTFSDAKLNRIVDALQSITLNNGVNYRITRSPAGTTILPAGSGPSANVIYPFTVSITKIPDDDSNVSVSITPGTVNGYVPTNVFDSFTVANSGTIYVKVTVTTDGQNVTSCEYNVDDSEADPQNATASSLPTTFDIPIALINNAKAYRTIGNGSLFLNGIQEFITDKDSPAGPGELTYIPYYVWQWSTF